MSIPSVDVAQPAVSRALPRLNGRHQIGNAGAATNESIGALNFGAANIHGPGILTLQPNAAQPLTFNIGSALAFLPAAVAIDCVQLFSRIVKSEAIPAPCRMR